MTGGLVAGLVAGYGVALPVGAIATYLVGLAARQPFRIAAAAALGVATTDGCFALVAVVGGAGLERVLRPVATPMTGVAAAVLILVAARTVKTGIRRYRGPFTSQRAVAAGLTTGRAYLWLVSLTALNPSTVAYFTALVLGSQGRGPTQTVGSRAAFVGGVLIASASWQLLLAGSGAMLGRAITGGRGQLLIAVVSASIMVILAAGLLLR